MDAHRMLNPVTVAQAAVAQAQDHVFAAEDSQGNPQVIGRIVLQYDPSSILVVRAAARLDSTAAA